MDQILKAIGVFFASLNWGDIPSWLSLVGALAVGSIAYFRRSRIFSWFRRATNAPPSFESQPSWEMVQDGAVCKVTNHGPGDAFDVRFGIRDAHQVGSPRFAGRYNFDRIDDGETVEIRPVLSPGAFTTTGRASLHVSWILRHDPDAEAERDWDQWPLRVSAWQTDVW
jgi:hypothetical protein